MLRCPALCCPGMGWGADRAPRLHRESPFPTLSKSSYSSCEGTSSQLQDFSQESPCNHRFLRSRASPVATRTAPQKQPTAKMIAPITICIRTPPSEILDRLTGQLFPPFSHADSKIRGSVCVSASAAARTVACKPLQLVPRP